MKSIIGREKEVEKIKKVFSLQRNLLLEGAVGVGKTYLIQALLNELKKDFVRVDGDSRYTEHKLTGWFDPPLVIKKGYDALSFIDGPLVIAMKQGKPLFINELNRMPEGVQNILLPAMDEKKIEIPKLGTLKAKSGFFVVATQNPKEFTATHALSEALMDRFEMLTLDYQSRDEELKICSQFIKKNKNVDEVVDLVRSTRQHPSIKRGASIRAVIAVCELMESGMDFKEACLMSIPSRIEMISSDEDPAKVISELIDQPKLYSENEKKKHVA